MAYFVISENENDFIINFKLLTLDPGFIVGACYFVIKFSEMQNCTK